MTLMWLCRTAGLIEVGNWSTWLTMFEGISGLENYGFTENRRPEVIFQQRRKYALLYSRSENQSGGGY